MGRSHRKYKRSRTKVHVALRRKNPRAFKPAVAIPASGTQRAVWCGTTRPSGCSSTPTSATCPPAARHGWCRAHRYRRPTSIYFCSFLDRDMGVDWRMGAEWFETCLLDYDPASNYDLRS